MTYTQALLKKKARQQDNNEALVDTAVVLGGAGLGYLTSKVVDPRPTLHSTLLYSLLGAAGGAGLLLKIKEA